jgi:hypothetical protein
MIGLADQFSNDLAGPLSALRELVVMALRYCSQRKQGTKRKGRECDAS